MRGSGWTVLPQLGTPGATPHPHSVMINKKKGKWEKQEVKLAWDRLRKGPAKPGGPQKPGLLWQVSARVCKGFNVGRGETFHTHSALDNEV